MKEHERVTNEKAHKQDWDGALAAKSKLPLSCKNLRYVQFFRFSFYSLAIFVSGCYMEAVILTTGFVRSVLQHWGWGLKAHIHTALSFAMCISTNTLS